MAAFPLHDIVRTGNAQDVTNALRTLGGTDVNAENTAGETALELATRLRKQRL